MNEAQRRPAVLLIELDLDLKDPAEAKKRLSQMCEKLLANTVIEEYRIEEPR